jgi:hypothetical protein
MAIDQFGTVEIVPGITGPERITGLEVVVPMRTAEGGHVPIESTAEIAWSEERRRYLCTSISSEQGLSAEMLRYVTPAQYIKLALLAAARISTLPNDDHLDPWGLEVPEDVREAGIRTQRGLRWVRHLDAYATAVSLSPAKAIQESFGVSAATAGRWLAKAREQ